MERPLFLTMDDVFHHHEQALLRHGGKIGAAGLNLVESALHAPTNRFLYEGERWSDREGTAQLAATYWVHLALAHGFADGNKRVGFACFLDFLHRNGYAVDFTDAEATDVGLAIAARTIDREAVARCVAPHLVPV